MKKRVLGAIIVLGVLITSLILGDTIFALVMTLVSTLGLRELIEIKYEKRKINFIKVLSYILMIVFMFNNVFYKVKVDILLTLTILLFVIPIVFYNDKDKYNILDAFYFIGGVYFLSFAFSNIVYLRDINIYKCIYVFIISFITDTYAYIGGMLIGKHHFTDISPKKTIEGSIIGTIMGVFIGSMFYYAVIGDISLVGIIFMSFVLTILSEIGDLSFSSIKRYFGKKDYSNLIPGHGGILDRFDSVIFVSLGIKLLLSIL